MAIYFFSDLHLQTGDDPATLRFQRFLQERVQSRDTLILGGDIFDLFVGNKRIFRERFSDLLRLLHRLASAGAKIHYLEGNHDFHMAEVFAGQENIVVYERGFEVGISGKRFWIAHGDEIDREDYGYRLLRYITRSLPFQWLLAALPDMALAKIGNWSSKQSRKYNSQDLRDGASQSRTRNLFRLYAEERAAQGYELIFLGHSHLADDWKIPLAGREAEYFNLGFASEKLLYGRYDSESGIGLEIQQYQ